MDIQNFYLGQEFEAYKFLGVHIENDKTIFRAYAPNAEKIELIINEESFLMNKILDFNFYEFVIDKNLENAHYEYKIYSKNGIVCNHTDPYAFYMELRPNHKSIVSKINNYSFHDNKWQKNKSDMKNKPLNIYEIHLGSWKKPKDKEFFNYKELAKLLVPYLIENGYNFVEFMPINEHPCDESWGYQNTGFYSPTSRYGKPNDLKYLIDKLHQNNIGVILDFVPVHFAIDDYGLAKFDGTALYEYPHNDVSYSEWGSCNFIHSRGDVRSFLQSCANYWMSEFHFDGIRFDAISRIIYWQGNEKRGENGKAIEFLKVMNQGLKLRHPNCLLIAEDSTNYKGTTKSLDKNGLGFDYKWDLGWMHDTLELFQSHTDYRTRDYHKLTFSMVYFYNENYILPFSHDEVVHGKATILQKMNGEYADKFSQAKTLYLYMMTHPGKKLNFMGNEIGQLREWDEKREQDWGLLSYPTHDSFNLFMKTLNSIYLTSPALYERDYERDGFKWLDCHQESNQLYVYERKSNCQNMIVITNLSNQEQSYKIKNIKSYKVILNTDFEKFGGLSKGNLEIDDNIVKLPKYSGIILGVTY